MLLSTGCALSELVKKWSRDRGPLWTVAYCFLSEWKQTSALLPGKNLELGAAKLEKVRRRRRQLLPILSAKYTRRLSPFTLDSLGARQAPTTLGRLKGEMRGKEDRSYAYAILAVWPIQPIPLLQIFRVTPGVAPINRPGVAPTSGGGGGLDH